MKLIKRGMQSIFKSKLVKVVVLPTGLICSHYANGTITVSG
jgi:hypothetical protein